MNKHSEINNVSIVGSIASPLRQVKIGEDAFVAFQVKTTKDTRRQILSSDDGVIHNIISAQKPSHSSGIIQINGSIMNIPELNKSLVLALNLKEIAHQNPINSSNLCFLLGRVVQILDETFEVETTDFEGSVEMGINSILHQIKLNDFARIRVKQLGIGVGSRVLVRGALHKVDGKSMVNPKSLEVLA